MTGALKPYPSYKDSGVPWLGGIPRGWEIRRNKLVLREVDERSEDGSEELLTVSQYTGVTRTRDRLPTSEALLTNAESLAGYRRVAAGDLVMNIMLAWNGSLGVSPLQGIASPAYAVFRAAPSVESDFLHYLFRTPLYTGAFRTVSTGVVDSRLRLYPEVFLRMPCLLPPRPEQLAIVRFLDHMDRRIRRYIAAKRKLIALLNEQKQAIIHRAVTRGLDPDVHLKPSGVEWLGNVPEHWERILLGRSLRSIEQGWSPVAAEGELRPDQWAVLTLSSVKRGTFDPAAIKPIPTSARVPGGIEVKDGDLLLTRSNTRELVGDVCIVQGARRRTVLCDLIYRLSPNTSTFDGRFLMYQLLSRVGRLQIERDARGSSGTMPKVSQRHIRSWLVVAPPIEEQRRIAARIGSVVGSIDRVSKQAQSQIELIREHHTSLIADVVTGKLDVREVAAQLPGLTEMATLLGEDLADESADVIEDPEDAPTLEATEA